MIVLKWKSTHITPLLRNYQWLPITLWVKVRLSTVAYKGLRILHILCPHFFIPSELASLLFLTHARHIVAARPFRMRFSCLKCPYPRYLDDLLPHFPQVFTQMLPSQWGLSSGNVLLLSTTHSPRHSLSTFLHYFPPWHVLLAYLSQLFILFIVFLSLLECQLHEGKNFCLFCLMLHPQTWKSAWWTIGTQYIFCMNEWVNNTVSGEEISRLDNKVERR